jgi:hypothetical protein
MAGLPSWLVGDAEGLSAWDVAIIDGAKLPGVSEVAVPRKGTGIELYKPPGQAGHSIRDVGHENAKLTVKVRIWTEEQLAQLEVVFSRLRPGPKQSARRAVAFYHPAAQILGITRVYIMGFSSPEVEGDKSLVTKIELLEVTATRQGGVKKAATEPSLKGTPTAIKLPGVQESPAKPSSTGAQPTRRR